MFTERPWLVDSLDEWVDRLKGPPHKCAVVFVDNSGLDIVLGILPFVRELLRRGTEVGGQCNSKYYLLLLKFVKELLCSLLLKHTDEIPLLTRKGSIEDKTRFTFKTFSFIL